MLLLSALLATAAAATLPGLPLTFEVDDQGRWVLPQALPPDFVAAGVEPGWVLSAVDGHPFDSPRAIRRMVARGPARLVQLHFDTAVAEEEDPEAEPGDVEGEGERLEADLPPAAAPPPAPALEVVVQVPRAPFVHADEVGLLPWPEGFAPPATGWRMSREGQPLAVDSARAVWGLDPTTGGWTPHAEPAGQPDTSELSIPKLWWSLSSDRWAIVGDNQRLRVASPEEAEADFAGAVRIASFQGNRVEHLVVPEPDGVALFSVGFPRGTGTLPACQPAVPETCLVAGRRVLEAFGDLEGAKEEGRRMLGLACSEGVYRACLEVLALDRPSQAETTAACIAQDANACHALAREQLRVRPEATDPVTVGLLEHACAVDASGSLGERLRRLEDVGEGCVLLSAAADRLEAPDRALLTLDQACVLGRAASCDEATRRREEAFAVRTVQECESAELPLASSCVQLGHLLSARPIASTALDAFDAYLRGCELGDPAGCVELGEFVDRWGIDNPRVGAAEATLAETCAEGEQRACMGAAHLRVRHDPRTETYGQALALFAGACAAGESAGCIAGAQQRRIGKARRIDAPDPLAMWDTACDQSSPSGCLGLGDRLVRSRRTWGEAYTAWSRACDTGEAHACTELGRLVLEKHEPAWADERASTDYLGQGCENGDAEGCYWLAEESLPRRGEPPEAAYLLLERSCEGDHGAACASLADVHLDRRTSFDDEIAAGHLDRACANAEFESCKALGQMYLRGKGVEKDRLKAKEYQQKFNVNAERRYVRLGLHVGFPYVVGAEAELVAPIPAGPALAFAGSYSYLPMLGGVMMQLKGGDAPEDPPDLQYADGGVRLYVNNKARGLYVMGAAHWMEAEGGELTRDRELGPTLTRVGGSIRLGIHNEHKWTYTRVEMGLGSYGMVDLSDFDDEETGSFPLVQANLGFSFGVAPF